MALRPWSFAPVLNGVAFDDAAYRMQRIVYPALAWAVSLGDQAQVPAAMFAVNLVGIGAVAGWSRGWRARFAPWPGSHGARRSASCCGRASSSP